MEDPFAGNRDERRREPGEVPARVHAAQGAAVAAARQDLLAVEGALLRPHARLPQLLQARHVADLRDGRVPLQGESPAASVRVVRVTRFPRSGR